LNPNTSDNVEFSQPEFDMYSVRKNMFVKRHYVTIYQK